MGVGAEDGLKSTLELPNQLHRPSYVNLQNVLKQQMSDLMPRCLRCQSKDRTTDVGFYLSKAGSSSLIQRWFHSRFRFSETGGLTLRYFPHW